MLMAKQGKVCIVPDEMGNVIRVSKTNPEYGHVRLTQDGTTFTQTGWIKKVTKSTSCYKASGCLTNTHIDTNSEKRQPPSGPRKKTRIRYIFFWMHSLDSIVCDWLDALGQRICGNNQNLLQIS